MKRESLPDLLSSDMHREMIRKKWEAEEEKMRSRGSGPLHYQNLKFDEVREMGVGYFDFSKDEGDRKSQMEMLSHLRDEEFHFPGLDDCVLQAWSKGVDLFEKAGVKVSEVSVPNVQYSTACYSVMGPVEVASNMARYDGIEYGHRHEHSDSTESLYAATRHQGFNDVVRGRILAGNYFLLKDNYEKYFLQAQRVRRLIANDFQRVFRSGVDILLTPSSVSDARAYKDFVARDNRQQQEVEDVMFMSANLAGIPSSDISPRLLVTTEHAHSTAADWPRVQGETAVDSL
ncbi:glutamyl-tRNA(Gln) amidotransferase subunit A, mitochondrial-like [Asterias amurensis]|uniref:glutamyl-tRNA(Gln) amidotransferase subunit A, mitochondrial-like n=1 Tax=Asterias amurensis TaxID=7602 RepID=UPI003AB56768